MKFLLLLGALLVVATCAGRKVPKMLKYEAEAVMSCYYRNWAIYRPVGSLGVVEVEDIADLANVCTHLIYAFAGVDEDTGDIKITDSTADLCPDDEGGNPWWHCGYKKFTDLKLDHHQLKTLISVGGAWTGDIFSKISADTTLRGNFVGSVVPFIKEHNFDGLDMSWEFPSSSADKVNFVTLLSELAEVLHGEGIMLTAAVGVGKSTIDNGYDVPGMSQYVDLIHVMAYDYHGTWAAHTHHNAPLYKHPSDLDNHLTVNYSIHYLMELGAPADKLVLGLPMYGRCWTLDDPSEHDVGAPGTPGPNGPYSRQPGMLFYSEICKSQKNNNNWTVVQDEDMKVSYGYCITENNNGENTWCGYDDEESISNKALYAKTLGLRGVSAWAVDQDDVHMECGSQNFPLTRKAWEVFTTPVTTTSTTTVTTTTTALQCYSCITCGQVDDSTNIVSNPDYQACSTNYFIETGIVMRGATFDTHPDGECLNEATTTLSCFCTSNLCNDIVAAQIADYTKE